jgi:hypothetical protein
VGLYNLSDEGGARELLYAKFSIFSPSEATEAFALFLSLASLAATLYFAPKSRAKGLLSGTALGVSTIYFLYLICLTQLPKELGKNTLFEEARKDYHEGNYERAIENLNSFLAQSDIQDMKLAAQAHYYLALSNLKLSPPDCGAAVSQLPQIAPDSGGLISDVMNECKNVGCIDCQSITPFN